MKRLFILLMVVVVFLTECRTEKTESQVLISAAGSFAAAPYFTNDHQGNAVLCWTEQDSKDSLFRLKYAVYDAQTNTFNQTVTVPASAGSSNSAESMGKIAFKSDGTIVALFSKRFPEEKNPFAGAIYYSSSDDAGKTWSEAQYLHSDTAHAYGRSFFDLAVLKDGELAAVWLDGRYAKEIKGSALFFARTEKGKGFGLDTCLEKGTCECCRTDLFTDKDGNLHLAYRNIMYPSALSGKQVRDMVYKLSKDNGKHFSAPKTISNDNWEIEGCPHSGPSMARTAGGICALWFTAGGGAGLYYTASKALGGEFNRRKLFSASGRHPQMIALKDGSLAMVFEELAAAAPEHSMKMDHSKGSMKMNHGPSASAKVVLEIVSGGELKESVKLTNGDLSDNHAVLTETGEGLLVAWVREGHNGSEIYCTLVKPL
ncbi:sialidase family protein [Pedobacter psychroterrae]|uniref:Exo-alpha-sialidase n=1 Tax=Pedobacter psychroterrae TaxID=2530453 RepID=A0A4R0NAT2_9SPHI|nr:sialidase family protein [Pedobacter psychroterrae]TCC97358.1 exo-alpha-sialidase [Pedobacter psychroterrae]